jgi:hypothetical protein
VQWRGEKRSNATHVSRTDAEARLARKGDNQTAKLSCAGHAVMKNRHGLLVDLRITPATGTAERETALEMLDDNVPGSHRAAARSWAHDLDGDGDLDLSVVDEESDSLFVYYNGPVPVAVGEARAVTRRVEIAPNPVMRGHAVNMNIRGTARAPRDRGRMSCERPTRLTHGRRVFASGSSRLHPIVEWTRRNGSLRAGRALRSARQRRNEYNGAVARRPGRTVVGAAGSAVPDPAQGRVSTVSASRDDDGLGE